VHVGICEITIRFHVSSSLKDKRSVAKSVVANLRNKFNVSAAEVANLDDRYTLGLGVGAVSNSRAFIDRTFASVLRYLERDRRLDVETFEQSWC